MSDDFWETLDWLIANCRVVIDRPKGSPHPRFPEFIYPLDYGYLEGTTSGDGNGIDLYRGSLDPSCLSAVILTADTFKQDVEIKLILGCTNEETRVALDHMNSGMMRALLVTRPKEET